MLVIGVVVAVLALGVLYQRLGSWRDRRRFPPPGVLIDGGGHRLHAVCRGGGSPAVLFESGIAASSVSWAVVQPAVATFTRACAYDRAGFGWSERASSARTADRVLGELSAVVTGLDLQPPFVLVGHSFGSLVVRAYAARHPGDVAGLVLIDPPTEWLTITRERARLLRGGWFMSRIGALLAYVGVVRASLALLTGGVPGASRGFVKVFGPTTSRTLERLVGEVRKLPPEVHPVVQALWCQPKCFRAMGDHLRTFEREAAILGGEAPPPGIPIVVISSGRQPPEHLAVHRRLAESSACGRHVMAASSAHWVQFDEPDLVIEAVRDLVESARARGSVEA
jgi:pimeloyl-ACP methyl ester carboxylesterase